MEDTPSVRRNLCVFHSENYLLLFDAVWTEISPPGVGHFPLRIVSVVFFLWCGGKLARAVVSILWLLYQTVEL